MKKALSITLILLLILSALSGCGSKSKTSDEMTTVAKGILEAADKYLDNQISAEDAVNRLNELQDSLGFLGDKEKNTDPEENSANLLIMMELSALISKIAVDEVSGDKADEITEIRNVIAETVGEKTR